MMILTACSRGSEPTAPANTPVSTNTPKPSPTSAPPANTPNPVQNIIWQWVSVTDQSTGDKITVPNPENYTISFYPDGTLSGKADCNAFDGTYSQSNGFTIGLATSTTAFCGEASLDQQYINLLFNVAAGGPDGAGGLALETAGGAQRMAVSEAAAERSQELSMASDALAARGVDELVTAQMAGEVAREAAATGVAEIAEGARMMSAGEMAEQTGEALERRAKR